MKILVAIANYGTKNEAYLQQLLTEYRRMPFEVHIVVLSNIPKELGKDVEVKVGLPAKNPWSLPFGHKRLFADRVSKYDLFIYTEDDTLITERNIRAFLQTTQILPRDKVAGFLRYEKSPDGTRHISSAHGNFHWLPESVGTSLGEHFARFTNDHSACYILTRHQLETALASGGFLTEPYEAEYDMLCSAATDPYTRCGLTKVINISRIEDFLLPHLPNKYIGVFGTEYSIFAAQIEALKEIAVRTRPPSHAFSGVRLSSFHPPSKNYYEPLCSELVRLVPPEARSVLSLGMGTGATECELVKLGLEVTAIPLDSVICAHAEKAGVKTILCDLQSGPDALEGKRFDCLLMQNLLCLYPDPPTLLASYAKLLRKNGTLLLTEPNLGNIQTAARRLFRKGTNNHGVLSFNRVTGKALSRWTSAAGLCTASIGYTIEEDPSPKLRFLRFLPAPLKSTSVHLMARADVVGDFASGI
jgi:SAM-dependent methyltransferase